MKRKHLSIQMATAYSYELWAGRKQGIVHATRNDGEKISITMPANEVEKVAEAINAGKQPTMVVSATVYYATADQARQAVR